MGVVVRRPRDRLERIDAQELSGSRIVCARSQMVTRRQLALILNTSTARRSPVFAT
jgi:hypothetical protein